MSDAPSWLQVSSHPDPPAFHDLAPGEDRQWLTTVRNTADRQVPLTLQVRGDGDLVAVPDGLAVQVQACSEPWQPGGDPATEWTCPGTSRVVAVGAPPNGTIVVTEPQLHAGESRDYLATATLPAASGNATQDLDGAVTLRFTSTQPVPGPDGDDDGDDDLADTGTPVALLLVLAVTMLLAGLLALSRRRRPSRAS